MSSTLRLRAFGDPVLVSSDGGRVDEVIRKTRRFALLIYLACHEHPEAHQRDAVVATFWPESDEARGRNALRQAVFVIRDALGDDVIVTNGAQELLVNRARLGSDVGEFEEAVRQQRPEEALALYRADFLMGFRVSGCHGFDAWMESRRLQLLAIAFSSAQHLAHVAEGHRDLHSALHWWRKAQELRPFDEVVLCRTMALLAGSGNRGRAVAEFERFRRRMSNVLGVEPSPQTQELAKAMAVRVPDRPPMWIGDRRRESAPGPAGRDGRRSRWRRPSDRVEG